VGVGQGRPHLVRPKQDLLQVYVHPYSGRHLAPPTTSVSSDSVSWSRVSRARTSFFTGDFSEGFMLVAFPLSFRLPQATVSPEQVDHQRKVDNSRGPEAFTCRDRQSFLPFSQGSMAEETAGPGPGLDLLERAVEVVRRRPLLSDRRRTPGPGSQPPT
jgi:hypothetical protein